MKVILRQDVPNLGKAGEVKTVADGYARNYLIPRGLATVATANTLKQVELQRTAGERRRQRVVTEATGLAQALARLSLRFQAKVGEKDRLYGSITSGDIAKAIERDTGQAIDKRKIELDEPIKELGTYTVSIRLQPEVTAQVTVVVEREENGAA